MDVEIIEPGHTLPRVASESTPALRRGLPSPSSTANESHEFFPTMRLHKDDASCNHEDNGPLMSSSAVKTVQQIQKSFGGKEGKPFVREGCDMYPIKSGKSANGTILRTFPDPVEDQDVSVEDEIKDADEEDSAESESEEEDEKDDGDDDANDDSDVPDENEAMDVASDIGETEDELKVNAAGRQATSDEDEDNDGVSDKQDDSNDDDDDVEEHPWRKSRDENLLTFVSGKTAASTLGRHVHRPTPVSGGSRDNSPLFLNKSTNVHQDASDGNSSSSSSSSSSGGRGRDVDLEDSDSSDSDDSGEGNDNDCNDASDEESMSSGDSEDLNLSDAGEHRNADDRGDADSVKVNEDENEDEILVEDNKLSSSIEVELKRALDRDESEKEAAETEAPGTRSTGKEKRLDLLKRESISMEELENIIAESPKECDESDLESELEMSHAEPSHTKSTLANNFSDEEVSGLLSDSFEFDYWSNDTVSAVVKVLSTMKDTDHDLKCSQYPIRLPSSEDASFWIDKMLIAVSPQSPALQILAESPEMSQYASKKIHNMFYAELSALDVSHVNLYYEDPASDHPEPRWSPRTGRHLFVGSFAAAESRLALAALHIKHVIQIAGHPLDELWVGDGVKYSTHILPGCDNGGAQSVCGIISRAAIEVASDFQEEAVTGEGTSVLVACSTGNEHSCAVCALFLMQTFGVEQAAAIQWMAKMRRTANIEPSWIEFSETKSSSPANEVPKVSPAATKRALSYQMLSSLLKDSSSSESPKRQRVQFGPLEHTRKELEGAAMTAALPDLPLFSLGESAQAASLMMRNGDNDNVTSSTDDDNEIEIERRLCEELADADRPTTDRQGDEASDPVPLLTPPASPLVIHGEGGDTTICEWPSNLAVDSAMTSAINLTRPLSPDSLQKQKEEEKRLSECLTPRGERQGPPHPETGLTPKLQGISVSFR